MATVAMVEQPSYETNAFKKAFATISFNNQHSALNLDSDDDDGDDREDPMDPVTYTRYYMQLGIDIWPMTRRASASMRGLQARWKGFNLMYEIVV